MDNEELYSLIKSIDEDIKKFKEKISEGEYVEDYTFLLKRSKVHRKSFMDILRKRNAL